MDIALDDWLVPRCTIDNELNAQCDTCEPTQFMFIQHFDFVWCLFFSFFFSAENEWREAKRRNQTHNRFNWCSLPSMLWFVGWLLLLLLFVFFFNRSLEVIMISAFGIQQTANRIIKNIACFVTEVVFNCNSYHCNFVSLHNYRFSLTTIFQLTCQLTQHRIFLWLFCSFPLFFSSFACIGVMMTSFFFVFNLSTIALPIVDVDVDNNKQE